MDILVNHTIVLEFIMQIVQAVPAMEFVHLQTIALAQQDIIQKIVLYIIVMDFPIETSRCVPVMEIVSVQAIVHAMKVIMDQTVTCLHVLG